jgi:hypothetical protein
MTTLTREQLRALADAADNLTRDNDWDNETIGDVTAALRAAADQLEAVWKCVVWESFKAFDGEEVTYTSPILKALEASDD